MGHPSKDCKKPGGRISFQWMASAQMIVRIGRNFAILVALLSPAVHGAVGTLQPGAVLQVSFTAVANTSDLLLFFNNDALTVTGSPVFTTELYNGSTLLAT